MSSPRALSTKQGILEAIRAAGPTGCTVSELITALGAPHQTVSARLSELKQDGKILDSGRGRISPAGIPATAWILPEVKDQDPRYHELLALLAPLPQLARTIADMGPLDATTITLTATNGPAHSVSASLPADLIRHLATL